MDGGGNFRANFGVERDGVNLLAEDGSYSQGLDITTGYPEFDHVLMKKLGWWDELTDAEKKAAEGKNWKTDLSGGIQRVVMKNHGCHPFGNAKARAVVWNFPDAIPQHREPLYSPSPDLVAKYPAQADKMAFWRLPTQYKISAKGEHRRRRRQEVPAGADERPSRRVRRRRRGDAVESVACRAAAGELRRDQSRRTPTTAADQRRRIRLGEIAYRGADQGEGDGHRTRRPRHDIHSVPFLGMVAGQGHARVLSGGSAPARPRGSRQYGDYLRLRRGHDDAGNQDDALPGRQDHARKARGDLPWPE